jgi:hypothetical protein
MKIAFKALSLAVEALFSSVVHLAISVSGRVHPDSIICQTLIHLKYALIQIFQKE